MLALVTNILVYESVLATVKFRRKFPRLDIAVTTSGLNIRKTILDYTDEDLDRVINLNIKGTVWPPMRRVM
jgi:NADP-dependent 3-hydroxy acid dehydrogenase YdfG